MTNAEETITQYTVRYNIYDNVNGSLQLKACTQVIKGVGVWTSNKELAEATKAEIDSRKYRDSSLKCWIETREY